MDEHFRGGHIGGHGDRVLVAQAGDIHDAVIHVGILGIVEEEDHIDLIVNDTLADLLDSPVFVGQEQIDRKTGGLRDHAAGGVGGAYGVLGQQSAVRGAELDHQLLLAVVTHDSNIHGGVYLLLCS